MTITKQNKRLAIICISASAVLLIPLVGMNFTNDINWNIYDFLVAGVLLIGFGIALELILRKIKARQNRIVLGIALFLALILTCVEIGVGIFGTVFSGT